MANCSPNCPNKATGTCYSHHGCRCDVCRKAHTARMQKNRKKRDPATLSPERHGDPYTYQNWNCRCEPCTEAWRLHGKPYGDKFRKKWRKEGRVVPPGLHGRYSTYTHYACRCEACRTAARLYRLIKKYNP